MKHLAWFYAVFLVVILFTSVTYEGFESSPATVLNDIANKKVLLFVYSDDCIHCKNMKPAWEKAAQKEPDKMVAINATDSSEAVNTLKSKLNITSYPAIFVMNNGKETAYEGGRTEQDFLDEVHKM